MSAAPAPYSTAEYVETWERVKARSATLDGPSLADRLALCEEDEPGFLGRLLDELGPLGSLMLAFDASFWLRPKQLEVIRIGRVVGGPRIILFCAGRGNGKTRTAAEWVLDRLLAGARVLVLVGPSYDDVRQFMAGGYKKRIDGANGSALLDVLPPWVRYEIDEEAGRIEFPDFGAVLYLHSAEVPEYRGPEPDSVWGDEVIKWRYPDRLLSNLRLACRAVGKVEPQIVLTTSPKKLRLLRDLVMDEGVLTIHGASNENVGNTHEGVHRDNVRRLTDPRTGKLTRQGLEELGGELGVDEEGELFPMGLIEQNRVELVPALDRIVVAIDPAMSHARTSDETGLVAAGREGDSATGHGYVLEDRTAKYVWEAWGDEAFVLAEKWGASAFVLERNKVADAGIANLRTSGARRGYSVRAQPGTKHLVELVHDREGVDAKGRKLLPTGKVIRVIEILAMGDKASRAGPVSTLYHTGRMHHVGAMPRLDAEISEWDPTTSVSPNGLDALVHGATELFELDRPPRPSGSVGMVGLAAANTKLDGASARRGSQWVSVGHDRRRTI